MKQRVLIALVLALAGSLAQGQGYTPPNQLPARIKTLLGSKTSDFTATSLATSPGGNPVWLYTLGRGDFAKKPALAIVCNVEGTGGAATEMALQLTGKFLNTDSLSRLLDRFTLYILPLVNPDAYAQHAAPLKYERTGNGKPTDDDRDGRTDEDGPDDLNGDGLITTIRIEDPTGPYLPSKTDPRVLVRADPSKGEVGRYRLISEGIDNDGDGQFNEDGPGGIALNRNFTFDYEPFKPGTGDYPVSEAENRALIDWLYTAPNVYAIVTLGGPSNNLSEPTRFDRAKTLPRILKGWLEKDAAINEQVSKFYTGAGLNNAPSLPGQRGDFPQWAYFHFGKLSFSTPGWWVPRDTTRTGPRPGVATPGAAAPGVATPGVAPGATPPVPSRFGGAGASAAAAAAKPEDGAEDIAFLKWAKTANVEAFVDWKPITHPNFPGQKAEVGGIVPFARHLPPYPLVLAQADKHLVFVQSLLKAMPQLELVNVKTESLSAGLTRLTVDLHNRGSLPSQAELAERVKYQPKIKVSIALAKNQKLLTGRPQQLLRETLPGGGTLSYSWLISGVGSVTVEAGSAPTGTARTTVTLK